MGNIMKATSTNHRPYPQLQYALTVAVAFLIVIGVSPSGFANTSPGGTGGPDLKEQWKSLAQNHKTGGAAFNAQNTNSTAPMRNARPSSARNDVVLAEVGPNHRSWKSVSNDSKENARTSKFNRFGSAGPVTTNPQVIEMATGMNYWDGRQWLPSEAVFELTDDAFVANRVQHRTRLNADLNVVGAVTTSLQNGTTLRSTPVAIALYDPNDGRFTVISTITNSIGILVESNKVVYPDAFTGGVCASVIYTIQQGTFEQDVVITGRLNPLDYGFPTNAQIQVITEFYDAPQPEKIRRPIYVEQKESVRRRKVSPDLVDEVLGFSDLVFGTGRAYMLPSAAHPNGAQTVVAKEFKTLPEEGRTFLIETINCLPIQKQLDSLPECAGGVEAAKLIRRSKERDGYAFVSKPNTSKLAGVQPRRATTQIAQRADIIKSGLVVDYFIQLGAINNSITFKSGVTYLVSGTIYCNGPVTLESAIFKYTSGATIKINSWINCRTSSYYPAIFTCVDDDSVGELVPPELGWTGTINPAGYANPAIWSYWYLSLSLSNVRFSYAQEAIRLEGSEKSDIISHAQIINCVRGIVMVNITSGSGVTPGSGFSLTMNNSLLASVQSALIRNGDYDSSPGYANFNHCTVDNAQVLATDIGNDPWLLVTFKNSVLANINSLGNAYLWDSTYNGFYSSPVFGNAAFRWSSAESPFQTSGGGAHYLKADSVFRGKGNTAGLPAALLNALKAKSTQPPIDFPRLMEMGGELTLFPQTPRYTSGPPDLGYWYDVLDYTCARMVSFGNITVLPGTVVGFRNEYAPEYGIWTWWGIDLREGSTFTSHGTPFKPNVFTDVQFVQEQVTAPCISSFLLDFWPMDETATPPTLDFRFSDFYASPEWYHFWGGYDEGFFGLAPTPDSLVHWRLRDCNISGGRINLGNPDDGSYFGAPWNYVYGQGSIVWFNNTFNQVSINLDPTYYWWDLTTVNCDMQVQAHNNLFREGTWLHLSPAPATAGNWVFKDNLFDKVSFFQEIAAPLDFDYNAYWRLTQSELDWLYGWGPWWAWPANAAQLQATIPGDDLNGGNERILTTAPPYQAGSPSTGGYEIGNLGNFYLTPGYILYSSSYRGSRSVADAGLYHYTTLASQTKNGTQAGNVVIGRHYVAKPNWVATQVTDSDNDGIPDYVEDANGNGLWDEGVETKYNNTQTESGIADAANAIYDDEDLDGDGMVGRIEKALGANPLTPDNPLIVVQIIEQEPSILSFKLPVNHSLVVSIGGMNLNVDGAAATLDDLTAADDGKCLLLWNTTFDRPGRRFLQPQLGILNPGSEEATLSAAGPIHPFYSDNVLQFFEAGSMFDDAGAYLDAELPVWNATYTIRLYDPSTTPSTLIRTIGPNTTWSGMIQEDWNVTYANESPFTGDTVEAVFDVTLLDESATPIASGISTKILSKASGALTESGPNFSFTYLFTPHADSPYYGSLVTAFAKNGVVWNGMQGVVDALIAPRWPWDVYGSAFNRYLPDSCGEYPGYVTRRSPPPTPSCVWTEISIVGNLLPDLASGSTKQFYCYAHGDPGGTWLVNATHDVYIRHDEISSFLGNTVSVRGELQTRNPYRFVFLDTCHSARNLRWAQAFGIARLGPTRNKVGPQAFVGWANSHGTGLTSHPEFGKAYTETLRAFYVLWMSGHPLASCIDFASEYTFLDNPFPVRGNEMIEVNGLRGKRNTCDIYVVGHSGLTVSGLNQSWDKRYQPPYQY